jgi:hypothetical protein
MEQQSFQKLVEPFIWNFIIENKLDEDNDNEDNDDDNNDNDDNNNFTMRSRGGELRSAIPVTTSNNLTPPPPVVAITLLPMGCKKRILNNIDPSVTLRMITMRKGYIPISLAPLGGKKMGLILLTHLLLNLCKRC